jgi:hypothetical protein
MSKSPQRFLVNGVYYINGSSLYVYIGDKDGGHIFRSFNAFGRYLNQKFYKDNNLKDVTITPMNEGDLIKHIHPVELHEWKSAVSKEIDGDVVFERENIKHIFTTDTSAYQSIPISYVADKLNRSKRTIRTLNRPAVYPSRRKSHRPRSSSRSRSRSSSSSSSSSSSRSPRIRRLTRRAIYPSPKR